MPKHRRARSIPNGGAAALPGTRGVLELERFTDTDLTRWNRLSEHLDYLHNLLHFGFESQRSTFRSALIAALQSAGPCRLEISRWCRIVQHRYSLDPLSPEGSLFHVGGRFNVGRDVPIDVRAPWPALYLASDTETAYREKYGMARNESIGGLSREELALMPQESHALVMVNGVVENTFDLSNVAALAPLCKVLAKFKMPPEVYRALKALRIDRRKVQVVRTPTQLQRAIMASNWRQWPVQFEVPAHGQILAGLVIAAGYEAIRYPSSKSGEHCVAVFPQNLCNDGTFIELADPAPTETSRTRIDLASWTG